MPMLDTAVLVLNLNYVPINVCNVKRAVILMGKGKAEQLANGRGEIHTPSMSMVIPSVIRLVYLVRRPFAHRKLSKKEVFQRDHQTCQYCGKETRELTLDHVVPRRQEGVHSWENIVTACIPCNRRKAGRTPAEASMVLLRQPTAPNSNPYSTLLNRTILEEWRQFLPWENRG